MAGSNQTIEEQFSELNLSDDDMGPGLNLETNEKIQRVDLDAHQAAGDDAPTAEQTVRQRKRRKILTFEVWNHFKRGSSQPDGSYDATCNYCGKMYPMGNQRSSNSMKHHITRSCKKIPSSKRHKPDALQRMLQADNAAGSWPNPTLWVFDQLRSKKNWTRAVIAHGYTFKSAHHHYLKDWLHYAVIEEGMDLGDTWPNDGVDDGASVDGESFVL